MTKIILLIALIAVLGVLILCIFMLHSIEKRLRKLALDMKEVGKEGPDA